MQADVEMLRRQQSDIEDRELEIMEQRETLDRALDGRRPVDRRARHAQRRSYARTIATAEAEIDAEIATATSARNDAAAPMPEPLLRDYERRRERRTAARAPPGSSAPRARPAISRSRRPKPSTSAARQAPRSRTATTAARSSSREPAVAVRRADRRAAGSIVIVVYSDGGVARQPGPCGDRRGRATTHRPTRRDAWRSSASASGRRRTTSPSTRH